MKKIFYITTLIFLAFFLNMEAMRQENHIKKYGRLKLVGKQLSDENGNHIQLKGWSSSKWMPGCGDCHQKEHLKQMKRWGANIYRGVMYVTEGGYNDHKEEFINQTKTFIDQTAELGLYYLCDWHVLHGNQQICERERLQTRPLRNLRRTQLEFIMESRLSSYSMG